MQRTADAKSGASPNTQEKVRLGPLAVRREATRLKVFKAAMECLQKDGFAATTTLAIVRRAKISRGALLKQFPTRVHLFDALVEYLLEEGARLADEQFGDIPAGIERAIAWADVGWALYGRKEYLSMLELGIGARSEPEISDMVARLGLERERNMFSLIWDDMKLAGATDEHAVRLAFYELLAVLQGLAIERLLNQANPLIEEAFRAYRTKYQIKLKQIAASGSTNLNRESQLTPD